MTSWPLECLWISQKGACMSEWIHPSPAHQNHHHRPQPVWEVAKYDKWWGSRKSWISWLWEVFDVNDILWPLHYRLYHLQQVLFCGFKLLVKFSFWISFHSSFWTMLLMNQLTFIFPFICCPSCPFSRLILTWSFFLWCFSGSDRFFHFGRFWMHF